VRACFISVSARLSCSVINFVAWVFLCQTVFSILNCTILYFISALVHLAIQRNLNGCSLRLYFAKLKRRSKLQELEVIYIYILYNVTGLLDQFWSSVVPCYATEDAVQIINSFVTIFTHTSLQSLTILSYAVTRLHNYNPYTPIFHSLIVSITHIHNSNKHSVHTLRNCFLPRTYCLALTLKTDFVSPMAFRITSLNGQRRKRSLLLC
jgi:hypothetical protein